MHGLNVSTSQPSSSGRPRATRSVRALIAGAAILAGATASAAQARAAGPATEPVSGPDEVAMAVPRLAPSGGDGVALPRPLTPSEAALIKQAFAAQARGDVASALRAMRDVRSDVLTGHILADRYLGARYRARPEELADWLRRFPDLPDAPAIHALLARRLPKGAAVPPVPVVDTLASSDAPGGAPEDADPRDAAIARNPRLDAAVVARAREAGGGSALNLIARTRGLTPAYAALLRAEVAQVLFSRNEDQQALDVAGSAFRRAAPQDRVALAGYVAGLAAWRLDRPALARTYFEDAAEAAHAPAALRAAAAFWAARAHLRGHDAAGYAPWMRRSAQEKRTFYGLLARRTLGGGIDLAGEHETLGEADVDLIAATDRGLRAFALLQVGESDRAEAELRALWPAMRQDPGLQRALMLVAQRAGLLDLSAQLAALAPDGRPRDDARFPLPKLRPRGGFRVDPALVYALTRLESNFDPAAVSAAGARGLMQLMPVTAGYVLHASGVAAEGAGRLLHDPAYNLDVGQRYVAYLAQLDGVGDDLIRVLSCYNSGPGSFARWSAELRDGGDPLLFIEAIPVPETRAFVQHALAYTWIYAARLGRPAPSLDALAAGAFPRFTAPAKGAMIAAAPRLH
jgi:soluble lytic murein transglycosylase-like protein